VRTGESPAEGKGASGGRVWLTRRARGGQRTEGSLATVGPDEAKRSEAAHMFTARPASS
jgi:hypothetical protein